MASEEWAKVRLAWLFDSISHVGLRRASLEQAYPTLNLPTPPSRQDGQDGLGVVVSADR